MKIIPEKRQQALTKIEVVVIVSVLVGLGVLAISAWNGLFRAVARDECGYGLRQVGLGFRVWAADHGDRFPMLVSTNQGGSREDVQAGDVVSTYRTMSNELANPRILFCLADGTRSWTTNFQEGFSSQNISYFVAFDAAETNANQFLAGDRDISDGQGALKKVLELTTNSLVGWPGELHKDAGNICMADGSVQRLSSRGLQKAVALTGLATNRLAVP